MAIGRFFLNLRQIKRLSLRFSARSSKQTSKKPIHVLQSDRFYYIFFSDSCYLNCFSSFFPIDSALSLKFHQLSPEKPVLTIHRLLTVSPWGVPLDICQKNLIYRYRRIRKCEAFQSFHMSTVFLPRHSSATELLATAHDTGR